jgi:hypothetical protein
VSNISERPDSTRARVSEVRVPVTIPEPLAAQLRQLAARDCSTLAATARRLIAHGVARESLALSLEGR